VILVLLCVVAADGGVGVDCGADEDDDSDDRDDSEEREEPSGRLAAAAAAAAVAKGLLVALFGADIVLFAAPARRHVRCPRVSGVDLQLLLTMK
jgi:hypothetical protein